MRLVDTKLLKETGKALRESNIVKVPRELIPDILQYVSSLTFIPVEDLHLVGSSGKVDVSGDLDIAININKYVPFKIHSRLEQKLGEDYAIYNKGTRIGSYAIPIGDGYRVQVDLMFVEDVEWAQFAYFSAGSKSKYKGAVRTILLSAVASALDEQGIDTYHYDGEELVVRVGRGIDLGVGLKRLFQMRPRKKTGDGYLKNLQKVTPEDIRKAFPNVEFDDNELIIRDPAQVVQILFGPGTRPSNVDTAEEVLDLIKRFPTEKKKKIFKIARVRAQQLKSKNIELPPELQ